MDVVGGLGNRRDAPKMEVEDEANDQAGDDEADGRDSKEDAEVAEVWDAGYGLGLEAEVGGVNSHPFHIFS